MAEFGRFFLKESWLAELVNSEAAQDLSVAPPEAAFEVGADAVFSPECAVEIPPKSKWFYVRRDSKALLLYLLDSEVHTFAFSVAANSILSFIPLIVLLFTLARSVFHSDAMMRVIGDMIYFYFPSNQGYVATSLANEVPKHGVQVLSLVMILIACTGIFLPLEVALNQAWGIAKSRNYLLNQTIAIGLALLMVILGMGSVLLNAAARSGLAFLFFQHVDNFFFKGISFVLLAVTTAIAAILFFFFIYWLLPNCKVPWRPVFRTAIVTGIIWQIAKFIYMALLPHFDFKLLYGPFYVSVSLLFWAYTSGLILFAGAQFSVSRWGVQTQQGDKKQE